MSWASARFLRAFLFGVEHGDPGVAALVVTLVGVIVACSSLMPLRLALAIEPTEALRVR